MAAAQCGAQRPPHVSASNDLFFRFVQDLHVGRATAEVERECTVGREGSSGRSAEAIRHPHSTILGSILGRGRVREAQMISSYVADATDVLQSGPVPWSAADACHRAHAQGAVPLRRRCCDASALAWQRPYRVCRPDCRSCDRPRYTSYTQTCS